MEKNEILAKMQRLFIDVLDNEDIILTEETTSNDIEEWDSLSHIQLIVEIEKTFGIKLTAHEVTGLANIGEMIDTINKRIN